MLAAVQLTSPHGNRAVSLQERQAEMLREKIKALEHRIMDMVRHGNENVIIADRLQRWARNLMLVRSSRALPATSWRNWDAVHGAAGGHEGLGRVRRPLRRGADFAGGVSDDAKTFASSLTQPYCGVNSGFEAVDWLDDPAMAMSVALLPLRAGRSRAPARPSACWCWPRPTRSGSQPAWAPTSSSASPNSRRRPVAPARRMMDAGADAALVERTSNTSASASAWPSARWSCTRST
jgi:uncharacterized protein YigA (DUF484 family)